jgi:DNA-binding transcriptional LysR family regulator
LELKDLMAERWTLSPPDSFLGQIVHEEFRRRNLAYPKATVMSISIDMRLTLLASGKYLTMLPVSMLRHPADKTWLRALPVKFENTSGSVAAITLKRRRAKGAVELFQRASRDVALGLR